MTSRPESDQGLKERGRSLTRQVLINHFDTRLEYKVASASDMNNEIQKRSQSGDRTQPQIGAYF